MNRSEFEKAGFYFRCTKDFFDKVPNEVSESKRFKYLKTFESFSINENTDDKKGKVYDFLYSNELQQDTGVTTFTTCDEGDWDKVKNYISGKGINGVTGKAYFLNNNEDITETEFDKYYNEWLDYIEDERNMESRNQQDFNF